MQKNKALLPLIRLSQFNQWATLAMPVSTILLVVMAGTDSLLATPPSGSEALWIMLIPAALLLPIFAALSCVFFLPAFLIFKNFVSLLKKYRELEFVDLSTQIEVQRLRKYLWLQFFVNVIVGPLSGLAKPSTASPSSLGPNFDTYLGFFDKFDQVLTYANWVTISLQHAMPLIFLLFLHVAVGLNQESVRLRAELDEVV